MEKFNLTAQLQLQQPTNTQSVVNYLKKQFSNIGVNVRVNSNPQAIRATSTAIGLINTEAISASKSTTELGKTLGLAARRFGAISIATGTFLALTRSIKNSVAEAISFERELNKITQATGATGKALTNVADEITRLSTGLGVSSKELILASRTLAQAGFSAKNTAGALKILSETELAATFDSIQDTGEGMIALLQQFGKEAIKTGTEVEFLEKSLSAINTVSKLFAVESADIISAIRKTGGSFEAAGGNINELIALFTSVRATTRESADTIATAFRTIFTRLQRTDTIDALRELGIQLQDAEGKFVGPLKAIEALSVGLSVLDTKDFRFSQIVEELGGFRQIGKVIPLVKQFAITQEALNVAQKSSGSLAEDAATAQQTLAVQITKVREEFSALVREFVGGKTFKSIAGGALEFARALIRIADAIQPLLPLVASFAAIQLGKGLVPALGTFSGITKRNSGGPIHKFASGGFVPGSGNGDTVPAMLTPGEFVIRKASVQKLGADTLAAMNSNRYATGGIVNKGIVNESEVGALILDRGSRVSDSKTPIRVGENEGFKVPKTYSLRRFGINEELGKGFAKNLESNIGLGLVSAVNRTSKLFEPLGVKPPIVPDEQKRNFIKSIGRGPIGALFESIILGLKGGPFEENQARPFDFVGGIGQAAKLFTAGAGAVNYEDAKASLAAARPGDFKRKIRDQAKLETGIELPGQASPGKTNALAQLLKGQTFNSRSNLETYLLARGVSKNSISGSKMVSFLEKSGIPFTLGQGMVNKQKSLSYKFAKGGTPKGTDTVPAMLTPGEFVVQKEAAKRIGYNTLSKVNKTGDTQYLAKGGAVQGFAKGGLSKSKAYRFQQLTSTRGQAVSAADKLQPAGPYGLNDPLGAPSPAIAQIDASIASQNAAVKQKNSKRAPGDAQADAVSDAFSNAAPVFESVGLTGETLDKAINLYIAQIKKGVDSQTAMNKSIEAATKLEQRRISGSGSKANVTTKTVSPNGPVGPGGAAKAAGAAATGGEAQQTVSRSATSLSQNFLFMGGAIATITAQMGGFSSATAEATAQAFAMAASIYGIGSTILDSIGNFKGLNGGLAKTTNTLSTVASTVPAVTASTAKLATETTKTSGFMSRFGGGMNVAQGALAGFAVGMAVVQAVIAGMKQEQAKASKAADDQLNKVRETGQGSKGGIEENLIKASRLEAQAQSAQTNGTVGAAGGALAGAATGALLGSFVPVIGNVVGGIVGGIIGGVAGGYGGAATGTDSAANEDAALKAVKGTAAAQYTAAKASYDFANSLDLARQKNLTGSAALDNVAESTKKLIEAQNKTKIQSRKNEINRISAAQNRVTTFGGALGYQATNTEEENKAREAEKAGLDELAKQQKEASTLIRSGADEAFGSFLAAAKSSSTLEQALKGSGVGKQLDIYKASLEAQQIPQEQINSILKSQMDTYKKQITASNESLNRQAALVAAKEAEISLILKTNAALNSLAQSSRDFQGSQDNVDRTLGTLSGSGKRVGVDTSALNDITRVGNQGEFANTARQAAAPLGAAGQELANQVISSASAIEKLRTGLTIDEVQNVKNQSGLNQEAGREAGRKLLSGKIGEDVFASLGKDLQDSLIGTVTSAGGPNAVGKEEIESIVKQFEGNAQKSSDVLKQSAELQERYLSQYDQVTSAIIDSMNKEAELRVGLVNIQQRGQDRLAEVFKDKLGEREQAGLLVGKQVSRTQAGQEALGPALTARGVKAGNVSNLSASLKNIRGAELSTNNALQNKSISSPQRAVLETNNKALADSAAKVTAELTRLADQSDRAADVMGQIDKERAKRDFKKGQVEDFVLGGQDDRQKQIDNYRGANVVARTGSFQGLPEEMRKGVADLLKQIAEVQPGGPADKIRQNAIRNDSINAALAGGFSQKDALAIGDLALNKPESKEEALIQELRKINAEEEAAQKALIGIQMQNTATATQLLAGVQQLIGVIGKNFGGAAAGAGIPNAPSVPLGITPRAPGLTSRLDGTAPAQPQPGDRAYAAMTSTTTQPQNRGAVAYNQGGVAAPSAPAGVDPSALAGTFNGFIGNLNNVFQTFLNLVPQSFNGGLENVTKSMMMLSQSFANIQMTHTVTLSGQINVAGINSQALADAIKDSVGQYIVSYVNKQFADRAKSLKAG